MSTTTFFKKSTSVINVYTSRCREGTCYCCCFVHHCTSMPITTSTVPRSYETFSERHNTIRKRDKRTDRRFPLRRRRSANWWLRSRRGWSAAAAAASLCCPVTAVGRPCKNEAVSQLLEGRRSFVRMKAELLKSKHVSQTGKRGHAHWIRKPD